MIRIRKTKRIDRRGMIRMSRRFGIAPVFVANLQRNKVVELPDDKALALIAHGYAIRAYNAPVDDMTVDDSEIETTEKINADDYAADDESDDKDDDSDDSWDDDEESENDDRDVKL